MTQIKNATGTKAINITKDASGVIRAMLVQIYNGEQQVLLTKSYKSMNAAKKWAKEFFS